MIAKPSILAHQLERVSPPPRRQDAQMQWQHVPGPGPPATGRVSFATAFNGFDHRIDPGVPNEIGEQNDPGESFSSGGNYSPVDCSASPPAEFDGLQDRRASLVHIAKRSWIDEVDDDLHPMIPLEEDALAAWIMGGKFRHRPGFWYARTREPHGLRCLIFLRNTSNESSSQSCLLPSVCLNILPRKRCSYNCWNVATGRRLSIH